MCEECLTKLREKDLPVKLSKCEFHKHTISFLGYRVSREGLIPDPIKVQATEEWPEPTTVKEIQAFLGLANYYRKFIEGFSRIAAPLTELTKKEVEFNFGEEYQESFKEIKRRLSSTPILTLYNPELQTDLETDTSDYAIGACLTQKGDDDKSRPIAYYSRKITRLETNYDIHDKELLAVVESLKE